MLTRFISRWLALFRPGFVSWAPAVAAGIGLLSNRGGGSGGGSSSPAGQIYQPAGLGAADTTWQQLLSQMFAQSQAQTGAIDPVLAQAYSRMLGIDTQPLLQAGQRAGGEYAGLSDLARALSQQMAGGSAETMGAGRDVYALGRDPMGELEARERQKVVDASRAASSARGYAMSPYSAGLETGAVRDFNLDWQNNLLLRSINGLNAMIRAGQVGGQQAGQAMDFGGQVPVSTLASATAPFQAAQQAFGWPAQAAQQYAGARGQAVSAPQMSIQSQIIPYLNQGIGAGQGAAGAMLGQQGMDFRQQQANLANIYGALGTFYGAYKNPADRPWSTPGTAGNTGAGEDFGMTGWE